MRKKRNGLTLIEIVCVVAILGIMGGTIIMAFNTGVLAKNFTTKEYDLQANMRSIADDVQNIVRYSTALFILPESSFNYTNAVEKKDDYLTEGWNYIGLIKDKNTGLTKIVEYTYNGTKHVEKVLVEEREDLIFDVTFAQDYSIEIPESVKTDPNVIEYSISGYRTESPDEPYIEIKSEAETLNSLQVVDWSTGYDKGVAIAYRSDERGRPVIGRVTLILDTSGSMAWDMDGNSGGDEKKRINILQGTVKELLANLATEESIEVMIIPFNDFAAKTGDYVFLPLSEHHEELLAEVDALIAKGATNTGDAMRRAHHAMLNAKKVTPQSSLVREYVIILADGDTNRGTLMVGEWNPVNELDPTGTFLLEDGDPKSDLKESRFVHMKNGFVNGIQQLTIVGIYGDKTTASQYVLAGGATTNVYYPDAYQYVEEIGKLIAAPELEREFFVIGFTNTITEYCLSHLATNVGLTSDVDENGFARKFQANSEEDLANAFGIIHEAISRDLWYIKGPKTVPTT